MHNHYQQLENQLPEQLILPPRTLRGPGSSRRLLQEAVAFGQRGLIVHGTSLIRTGFLQTLLAETMGRDILPWRFPGGEPTTDQLEELLAIARGHGCQWVAGIGGGSVLDIAKAAAGLLEAGHPVSHYHDGADIPPSRIPFLAVPTTAGTGSEATMVAVLTHAEHLQKKSIRHPSFMASCVILDGERLDSCPPQVIAHAGMDALTQAIEAYISRHACWWSDACARQAICLIAQTLEPVYAEQATPVQKQALLEGSFLAGIALGNARLGLVHGLAHPLGARYHLPHGHVCAACLPSVLHFNAPYAEKKLQSLQPLLNGMEIHPFVTALSTRLNINNPFAGKTLSDADGIMRETLASGSTAANPRPVGERDLTKMLSLLFR